MPANAVKHRFIPMRDAFAPQIGFSCQTRKSPSRKVGTGFRKRRTTQKGARRLVMLNTSKWLENIGISCAPSPVQPQNPRAQNGSN